MSDLTPIIRAENLGKTYGDFQALKGVSFAIYPGECFGFIGHNGAGKTTTMRMIYGMSKVQEGSLELFGERISLTPPALKARLGVVPQEDNLDPDLSVIENLAIYGGIYGLKQSEAKARGYELLRFMGLEDKENHNVEKLSGGLKRRLVIARALINRPEVVILDEPTTGLDPQARHLVWQKLRGLKVEGVTLLLTTHYMEEAAQLCDRLVIMHKGIILDEGSPQELVSRCVLPFVIEVRLPMSRIPAGINEKVRQAGGEVIQVAEGLFLYFRDGQTIWDQLAAWGLPPHSCFMRPANLEDVFLKLTDRGGAM
ncbi:ABC transporter ATP-binding protein [Methylomusa anaerophila]|uniref:Daunorubicin/doxorubicin resistance ATP-binding protein DrrA n=1 Tax=Methylomusa anaerophila TaxID=1930071 RepID=A0A348AIG3_9FIRM|nr:ABC transporter ATP-binding protein [Methylomusa anaerophila]BBB90861.1 daunorubicin/doxorubicin resistance ATP-binding protein DrrA [Methylomusa anaerophila]